jgi:hypothetical protein
MRVFWPVTSTGHGADHIENTSSVVRMHVYWPVAQHWAWGGPHGKYFFQYPFYCCVRYFGRCLEMGLHVTISTAQNSMRCCKCIPLISIHNEHSFSSRTGQCTLKFRLSTKICQLFSCSVHVFSWACLSARKYQHTTWGNPHFIGHINTWRCGVWQLAGEQSLERPLFDWSQTQNKYISEM